MTTLIGPTHLYRIPLHTVTTNLNYFLKVTSITLVYFDDESTYTDEGGINNYDIA